MTTTYFQTVPKKHQNTKRQSKMLTIGSSVGYMGGYCTVLQPIGNSFTTSHNKTCGGGGAAGDTYEHSSKTLTLSQPSGGSLLNM